MTAPAGTDHALPIARGRIVAIVAATLLAGTMAAGCGDDDGGDASAPGDGLTTEATGDAADGASTGPVEIEIFSTAGGFEPTSATVTAGREVVWTNTDDLVHTTTASDGRWDSGDIEPGGRFAFAPEEPGTYDYVCTIHPTMRGELVVD